MPRPTRTRLLRAPLLSRISFSFIVLHSLSLFARNRDGLLRHRHHMPDGADHAADLGAILEFHRLVHLVEPEALQRRPLVVGATDRGAGLGDLDLRHIDYSATASASA